LNVYNQALDSFEKANGQLVAVSPNIPDSSLSTVEKHNLKFEVLSDVGLNVAKEYGIVYKLPDDISKAFEGRLDLAAYDADDSKQLPLTVTYVIGTDQIIKYAFINSDYRKRAETSDLIAVLKSLK